jgi:hypothetical protein
MSDSRRRRVAPHARAVLAALVVALAAAVLPGAAWAGSGLSAPANDPGLSVPGNQSAGDQYVETLPTTKGPRAPGRNKRAKKLSHGVSKRLQQLGGSDAATLEKLATSTALGAPVDNGTRRGDAEGANGGASHKGRSGNGKRHGGSTPAVPSAAINAVDGGEAGLGWLVLAILAITALSLGAVGYQRRRDKGSAE